MRKLIIAFFGFLLIALPLNGLFSGEAHAATSRVAVIKELKGTVKVKKAGGSKEFTAFAKMSLNEGDIVTVGSDGSAVLQFANGTDEDDRMTVASDSKLTFSKLSTRKGTTTKVSLWSGSAWVDVKSIQSSSDEFTLETPTAVMGVRGTHLNVFVDPITGLTITTVGAGVVQASTNTNDPNKRETKLVYPTQQVTVTNGQPNPSTQTNVFITQMDLSQLVSNASPALIEAIMRAAGEIAKENQEKLKQYESALSTAGQDLEALQRFGNNLSNLIGAIADQAVKQGKASQADLQKLVDEANKQSGTNVDLTKKQLQLTADELKKQEEQRKLLEQQQKLKQQQLEQEKLKQQKELMDKLLKQKEELEKQRQAAILEAQKKAAEEYQKKLSELEKQRFLADQKKLQPTPSPSTSGGSSSGGGSTPPLSQDATLSGLTIAKYSGLSSPTAVPSASAQTLTVYPSFSPTATAYNAEVPAEVSHLNVKATVNDASATVKVNGSPAQSGLYGGWIPLQAGENTITIDVRAASGLTKTYTVTVNRPYSLGIAGMYGEGLYINKVYGEDNIYSGFIPQAIGQTYTLKVVPYLSSAIVKVNGTLLAAGVNTYSISSNVSTGWHTYTVEVSDPAGVADPQIFTLNLWKIDASQQLNPIKNWYISSDRGSDITAETSGDIGWDIPFPPNAYTLWLMPILADDSPFTVKYIQIGEDEFDPNPYNDNAIEIWGLDSTAVTEGVLWLQYEDNVVGVPLTFTPDASMLPPSLSALYVNGVAIEPYGEYENSYGYEVFTSDVVISPVAASDDFTIIYDDEEIASGENIPIHLEPGMNEFEISVYGTDQGYTDYYLQLNYVEKPVGVASWGTKDYLGEVGPNVPLFWTKGTSGKYYAKAPYITFGGFVKFDIQFESGYEGKFDYDGHIGTYDSVAHYQVNGWSWDGAKYKTITMTIKNTSTLAEISYTFYVLDPYYEEDVLQPFNLTASYENSQIFANKQESGAYTFILPEYADESENVQLDATLNAFPLTASWDAGGGWQNGSIVSRPEGVNLYHLKLSDELGAERIFPVFIYQGAPYLEYGFGMSQLENSIGWTASVGEDCLDDDGNWYTALELPALPSGYTYNVTDGYNNFEFENDAFELYGSSTQATDIYIQILDEDENVIAEYKLKVYYYVP